MKPHLAAIALLAVSASSAQSQKDSALVFETVISTSVEGRPMKSGMRIRTIESRHGTRVEGLERTGNMPSTPSDPLSPEPGGYALAFSDGRMISVDTVRRQYSEIDLKSVLQKSSQMSQMMSSMNMKMTGTKFDVEDKGAGEDLLGHKTRHWQVHGTMTMSMVMNGDTAGMSADQVSDINYAVDITHMAPESAPGLAPDSVMLSMFRSFGGVDSTATMAMRKLPKTLALKTVARSSMEVGPMDMIFTMTTEITKLERTTVDASLFEIPRGYKKVEMPVMTPPRTM